MKSTKLYSLTHPQKRIWYIENIYPSTAVNNIGGYVIIKGSVEFDLLEESFKIFIEENSGVRLRLTENSGEPMQYIAPYKDKTIEFFDFSNEKSPKQAFHQWVAEEAQKPFCLLNNPLYYIALFRIGESEAGYLVKFHHIILDGWSVSLMTTQIAENYAKLKKHEIIARNSRPCYLDYLEEEKKYMSSERFLRNREFWNEKFRYFPNHEILRSSENIAGNRMTFLLDERRTHATKDYIKDTKYSLNTLFTALLIIFYFKAYQHDDMVIGIPVFNRLGAEDKNAIGMYTSTVPFRISINEDCTANEFISQINRELKKCFINQRYPYDILVKDLELRKKGYTTLYTKCVNYYNTRHVTQFDGYEVANEEFYNGSQIYSLQLVIKEWLDQDNIILNMDYKIDDFDYEEINIIYSSLIALLDQIIDNREVKVADLELMSKSQRDKVLFEFNETQASYNHLDTVISLFKRQVRQTPERTAVECGNLSLTYRELDEKSNQVAKYLINKGIKAGMIVGILASHSQELVAGILGILKAGAAYLPLNINYPKERTRKILEDAKVKCLLSNLCNVSSGDTGCEIIDLNCSEIYKNSCDDINLAESMGLAYVIYTSGSSGVPKGVMISHKSLLNYIQWAVKKYIKNDDDVFALYTSIAFDLTVTSIFTPISAGAKIIIYEDNQHEYALYRIMREKKVTVIKLTPSQLMLIKDLDNRSSSVRRIIIGGEDLKSSLARDVFYSFEGNIELYNEYGPTEATVGCMIYKYNPDVDTGASVPIGTPGDNVQIYIMDKNLKPLPSGIDGEICISGDGIAEGYLNREELTAMRFIPNPFIPRKVLYKTGDIGRFNSSGWVEYKGRADDQVKIRGYRIELGEIEQCLLSHTEIKNAVVLCKKDQNSIYLCAYLVTDKNLSTTEITEYLKNYLPDYMIPAYYVFLVEIPLSINGKVEKDLLPGPDKLVIHNEREDINVSEEGKLLVSILRELLGDSELSIYANFYHAGGDSIKAIQVASQVSMQGYRIKVSDILNNPVIYEMINYITKADQRVTAQEPCSGEISISPIISWFREQNFNKPDFYNQSIVLRLNASIGIDIIEKVLNQIVKHHDALRINCDISGRRMYYNNKYLDEVFTVELHDLTSYSRKEQLQAINRLGYRLKSSISLKHSRLFQGSLFILAEDEQYLLLSAHHLVIDGISWRIILQDIDKLIRQHINGEPPVLPSKTSSYKEWTMKLNELGEGFAKDEAGYWNSICTGNNNISLDFEPGKGNGDECRRIHNNIPKEKTQQLITAANKPFNTKPEELLFAALCQAVYQVFHIDDIIIELEGHGREDIAQDLCISRTVGWFTSICPVRVKISGKDMNDVIIQTKEQLRSIPNKGIGYGVIKYLTEIPVEEYEKTIRFNYLGIFDDDLDSGFFKLADIETGVDSDESNGLTCLIDINLLVVNGSIDIYISYNKNAFRDETINRFADEYIKKIVEIVDYCKDKKDIELTPSDFDTIELTRDELESLFK